MDDATRSGFIADGHHRAHSAIKEEVRSDVEGKYAKMLSSASPAEKLRLRREIERKIREETRARIAKLAPPDALY